MPVKTSDFDYELPEELIAQTPCPVRDQSRMLIAERGGKTISHNAFKDFPAQLAEGDLIVVNNSRVIPARLLGEKETGGRVEIFLLAGKHSFGAPSAAWEALIRPGRSVRAGMTVNLEGNARAQILERLTDKKWLVAIDSSIPTGEFIDRYGKTPLPPYIRRGRGQRESPLDRERYQTIYAKVPGSVAAPTAGLHFSPGIMDELKDRGISVAHVTLHVGYGTFRPMEAENAEEHLMDEEYYEISRETAERINKAQRVVAVGTTSVRAIESAADEGGTVRAGSFSTDLFIYPGYRFRRVNALLTNFHLPKSTLLLLVSAFADHDLIRRAYREAVAERYRFYSYGDCMLIL